jgi:hypothetical protein
MRQWRAEQGDETEGDPTEGDPTGSDGDTGSTKDQRGKNPKGKGKRTQPGDDEFNETKRELGEQAAIADKMIGMAEASKRCTPEHRRILGRVAAIVPEKLKTMERAGKEWLEHIARLKKAAAEAKQAAEVRTSRAPKPALSEPAQVSA